MASPSSHKYHCQKKNMKLGLLTAITRCASQPVILEQRALRGHPSQPLGSKHQATSIFEGLIRECNPREASGGGRGLDVE